MAFWLWSGAGILVLIVAIAVCVSSIRVRIRFSKSGKLDQLVIITQALYGLVHIKMVVPSIAVHGMEIVYKQKNRTQAAGNDVQKKDKRKISLHTIRRWRKGTKRMLRSIFSFRTWILGALRKVECTRWRLDVSVGTGDAAMTGVAAGLFWSVMGLATGVADRFIQLRTHPHGSVQPVFNRLEFTCVWEADFQIRLGSAIGIAFRLDPTFGKAWRLLRSLRQMKGAPEHA